MEQAAEVCCGGGEGGGAGEANTKQINTRCTYTDVKSYFRESGPSNFQRT